MRLKHDNTEQKLRGAYYTPSDLADAIIASLDLSNASHILEPSCGDGVFLEAVLKNGIDKNASIDAIEIDREAYAKASKNYGKDTRVRFHNRDFFEYYEKEDQKYDAIIGNPPYIRYQYLETEQRAWLSDILTRQGLKSNKLINAWVGFMVACTDLLKDNGVLAFVIPAEILQVAYAEDLRSFLTKEFESITLLTFQRLVFDDIEQETVVFIGNKGDGPCSIRVIESNDVNELALLNFDKVPFQPVHTSSNKWTRYFISAKHAKVLDELPQDERLVKLSDLARINVGVTTGNNSFFSITDEVSKRYDLDDLTVPLIGRSSHTSGAYFSHADWKENRDAGKRARLLVLRDHQYDSMSKKQQSYIDLGVENGENSGYKCSIRDSWYSVPSVWIPDAFFLRRNNLYPKFVLNGCNAISTDTMHRMEFIPGVDPELALISYYNSIAFAFTELCGRSYGGGVLEMLPKEVGNILVIDPKALELSKEAKKQRISRIDKTLHGDTPIEELLDYIDQTVLIEMLGYEKSLCDACRGIWKTLQTRRLNRGA